MASLTQKQAKTMTQTSMKPEINTLEAVKKASDQGWKINWKQSNYELKAGKEKAIGKYFIVCVQNQFTSLLSKEDVKDCYIPPQAIPESLWTDEERAKIKQQIQNWPNI